MNPVDDTVALPDDWKQHAAVIADPIQVPADQLAQEPRRLDQGLDGGGHRVSPVATEAPGRVDQRPVARVRNRPPLRSGRGRGARPWAWALAAVVPVTFLAVFFAWPVSALVVRGFVDDGVFSPRRRPGRAGRAADLADRRSDPRAGGGRHGRRRPARGAGRLPAVPAPVPRTAAAARGGERPVRAADRGGGRGLPVAAGRHGPLGFLGLQESFAAIVAALVFFNYSVVVRTVGALWSRLDPRAEDAARTLGAGRIRVLATVTLPALAPAIASAAALVFLFCASAFGVVLVLGGAQLRNHRDRDLVPDHPAARPAGRGSAVDPPAGGGERHR